MTLFPKDIQRPFSQPANRLEPEYAEAFQAWKAQPTPQSSGQLLRAVTPVIDSALRSYGSAPSPTLRSKAKHLSLTAFQSYNPDRGTLRTHLLSQLQSLRRQSVQEQNIFHVPERVQADYRRLLGMESELRDELGRDPSDAEIADYSGFSQRRLARIRNVPSPVSEGQTTASDPGASPPSVRQTGSDADEAWVDFIYADLGPTDRVVLDYTLGRNGSPQLTTNQIAQRLGITAGAVSQRTAKLQQMLSARHTFKPF